MSAATVHVAIPVLDPGDAASAHTLRVRDLLRDTGLRCDILAETCNVPGAARPWKDYAGEPVIYQLAIGSRMAEDLLGRRPRLVVNSHNLTPARFFEQWDPPLVHGTAWGRDQLVRFAGVADLGVGVSRFNTAELVDAGFARTATAPFLFDPAVLDREVDAGLAERLRAGGAGRDWLFVGRIVPNKAHHDLIAAFAFHRRHIAPAARLRLVGGASSRRYEAAVRAYVDTLGLGDVVTFTGPVGAAQLGAHYAAADVFVVLSDHEGFCVPVLEAMHAGVPVVAFDAGAVAETAGGAAVVLPEKSPPLVASAVERVLGDPVVRAAMVAAGRARVAAMSLEASRAAFRAAVEPWVMSL